jgi:hypothetical protein
LAVKKLFPEAMVKIKNPDTNGSGFLEGEMPVNSGLIFF